MGKRPLNDKKKKRRSSNEKKSSSTNNGSRYGSISSGLQSITISHGCICCI